ncbi:MAG: Shikimate dehydrogenase substrate binding domain protein [Flavipsychrobacter sp.]|nr:Shikimate dehydrogenase substrate binding domain protein [Flavipsychrobacter sp.]
MQPLYGLIGITLTHSFSPAYFKKKFAEHNIDAFYEAFPIPYIRELPDLLENNPDMAGLNVTIPYKEAIIPYLDDIDPVAAQIGAVNCVVIKGNRKKGFNTDAIAFEKSLNPLLTPHHTQALILGTGGSSKTVAYVLEQLGIPYKKVSQTAKEDRYTYEQLTPELISQYKLIINTTPLGMYPVMDECPSIPYEGIGEHHVLYDLIYNPEETKFLVQGKLKGATIKNGFEMLQLQAEASWDIWSAANTETPE